MVKLMEGVTRRRERGIWTKEDAMSQIRVTSKRTVPASLVRDNVALRGGGGGRHIIMVQSCRPEAGNCLPLSLVTRFTHPDRNIFCLHKHAGMHINLQSTRRCAGSVCAGDTRLYGTHITVNQDSSALSE
jgi:hypothetical protein